MTADTQHRYSIALELKGGEHAQYDRLIKMFAKLNAIEILNGLWIARCAEPIGRGSILWAIISTLGDDDRALVTNLSGPELHGFNLSVQPKEIVPGRKWSATGQAA